MALDTLWGIYCSAHEIYAIISLWKLQHLCFMNIEEFVFCALRDNCDVCTFQCFWFWSCGSQVYRYVPPYSKEKLKKEVLIFVIKKILWKFRMILRVQGGGVDENICMSLAREAMVQTKPQYWQS